MKVEGKQYFILGCLIAIGVTFLVADPAILQALSRQVNLNLQSREVRMTVDLGLYNPDNLSKDNLDTPVSRREFGRLLRGFLHLIGAPAGYDQTKLEESGIFVAKPTKQALSRKMAVEAVCRALIHLADIGLIAIDETVTTRFSDYEPPGKYKAAFAYLRKKEVIRGYPDGLFHASKAMTTRESITLLYRFYEMVTATIGKSRSPENVIQFVDLPVDHPMVAKIKRLYEAGAFSHVQRGPTFDGNEIITIGELQGLLTGIFEKRNQTAHAKVTIELGKGQSLQSRAKRRHLAILLGKFATSETIQATSKLETPYIDVPAGAPEISGLAILERVGITLGYSDRRLAGDEPLSWFETVGVIDAWLEKTEASGETKPALEEAATRSDFEEFAALIKAKKERIRGILDQRPRYRR